MTSQKESAVRQESALQRATLSWKQKMQRAETNFTTFLVLINTVGVGTAILTYAGGDSRRPVDSALQGIAQGQGIDAITHPLKATTPHDVTSYTQGPDVLTPFGTYHYNTPVYTDHEQFVYRMTLGIAATVAAELVVGGFAYALGRLRRGNNDNEPPPADTADAPVFYGPPSRPGNKAA